MKIPLSLIKADIWEHGGHIRLNERLMAEVKNFVANEGKGVISGFMRLERQPRGFINELEYGGIGEKMKNLNARFQGRR